MKITVAIPAHNAASSIGATLESVMRQTLRPDEVLVLDDGSIDDTVAIANSYGPRVSVLREGHKGVADARNLLVERAQGDLIAFLDSDDLWHPNYLQTQRRLFLDCPTAAASFTGHVNFEGPEDYQWDGSATDGISAVEVIQPLEFFRRYNESTGPFASMSYCCVARKAVGEIGRQPFGGRDLPAAEDSYFLYRMALLGRPIVYSPVALAAYRVRQGSASADRVNGFAAWVHAFELLEDCYRKQTDDSFRRVFGAAFASKRRAYGKILMGAGRVAEARSQFRQSLSLAGLVSAAKSSLLLLSSYMPTLLQQNWPQSRRPPLSCQKPGA